MSTSGSLPKPATQLDKAGCALGVLLGVLSLYMSYAGPVVHSSSLPVTFYDNLLWLLLVYLVPVWTLVMAAYFLKFRGSSNKSLGLVAGVVGLLSAVFGFFVAILVFPLRQPFSGYPGYEGWYAWLATWFNATLISGLAILLFGIVYLKVSFSSGKRNPFGALAGLFYVVIGVFGILIGLGPATAAMVFFNNFTFIPWMYGIVLVPSLLGLKS